jgi:hypothetical protein
MEPDCKASAPTAQVWADTALRKNDIVLRMYGVGRASVPPGETIPIDAALAVLRPNEAFRRRRWYRVFGVLPVLLPRFKIKAGWHLVGYVNLLQYQSGLRVSMQVWRRPEDDRWKCFLSRSLSRYAWPGDGSAGLGRWCIAVWKEAYLRCGDKLGAMSLTKASKWFHRTYRTGPLLIGTNGFGHEIDSAERAMRVAAMRDGVRSVSGSSE